MRLTESILTKLNESTWCGVPNTIYRYHGDWSDPEVEYKGKLYNEWDLQEYIGEIFNDYCKENNIDIKNDWTEKFGDWLSKNPDYAYDAFEVLEPVEIVRNDLGESNVEEDFLYIVKHANRINLEGRYEIRNYNGTYQISSKHPYDETDYSFARSTDGIN